MVISLRTCRRAPRKRVQGRQPYLLRRQAPWSPLLPLLKMKWTANTPARRQSGPDGPKPSKTPFPDRPTIAPRASRGAAVSDQAPNPAFDPAADRRCLRLRLPLPPLLPLNSPARPRRARQASRSASRPSRVVAALRPRRWLTKTATPVRPADMRRPPSLPPRRLRRHKPRKTLPTPRLMPTPSATCRLSAHRRCLRPAMWHAASRLRLPFPPRP